MPAIAQKIEFSVVVCTRNRGRLLKSALESLSDQDFSRERFEVIVVDNNSTDDTIDVIELFRERFVHFQTVIEPIVGASHARNAGLRLARAAIVAYLDDDAKARTSWLTQASIFHNQYPEVRAFGGGYIGFTVSSKPSWYPPEYGTYLLDSRTRRLRPGKEYLGGANLFLSRMDATLFGGFPASLGMKGDMVGYGEETRLQQEFFARGFEIYYVPELTVDHLIADYKLSFKWLIKSSYIAGKNSNASLGRKEGASRLLGKFGYGLLKATAHFLALRNIPLKRRCYYFLKEVAYRTAALTQILEKQTKH